MKTLINIIGLFISIVSWGQDDSLRLKVYSDFLNEDIYSYDTMFRKETEIIFVTKVDNFEPTIDIKYLEAFLNRNIEQNELYKSSFQGEDPAIYFDIPPTFGLGKTLKEDKEIGELMIRLFKADKADLSSKGRLQTNYQIKFINNPKPYFKMGWDKFHRRYPNCYGIVKFSNIVFNDSGDRALMYVESFKGSLDASGDIVVMRKRNNAWTIELQINQWVS